MVELNRVITRSIDSIWLIEWKWGSPAQTVSWMGVHSLRVTWSSRQTEQTEQANVELSTEENVPEGHLRHTVFCVGEQARAAPHPWAHSSQATHSVTATNGVSDDASDVTDVTEGSVEFFHFRIELETHRLGSLFNHLIYSVKFVSHLNNLISWLFR